MLPQFQTTGCKLKVTRKKNSADIAGNWSDAKDEIAHQISGTVHAAMVLLPVSCLK